MIGPVEEEIQRADEWVTLSDEAVESQLYWRLGNLHADRHVATKSADLTVYRDIEGRRGKASFTLSGEGTDRETVQAALTAAGLALNPPYRLPAGPAAFPSVILGDRELPERDALVEWGSRIQASLKRAGTTPSHLELFASRHEWSLLASNGRRHDWLADEVVTDLVVAAGTGEEATEFRVMRRGRSLADLLPETVLEDAVRTVRDRQGAKIPPTGRMAVVLPSSELAVLLEALLLHTEGRAVYTKMVQRTIGDNLIPAAGDPVSVTLNPLRPKAARSAPTDASTVPSAPLQVLEAGVIRHLHADPQYAAYLGVEPTGPAGTLELMPGDRSGADFFSDGPVLEVVAFSANMPDPLSGNFACEIKMGYLHQNGTRTPVAQGSVTGNIFEALANCRLSKETAEDAGYFGPARIRFATLQVAGG